MTHKRFRSLTTIEQHFLIRDSRRTNHYTLERMQQAVVALGNPQLIYDVVHVGGTSGKGSTCHFMASILKESGVTVGLFTSPAIVSPLERIQINGRPITEKKFVQLTNSIWEILEPFNLTYFEFFTVMALYFFARAKVRYAVIEVGMGGRLDATNIVTPKVAIVTTIGLDHTGVLGRTRQRIAREKEHIIKPGCIGLTGSRYVQRGKYVDPTRAKVYKQDLSGTSFSFGSNVQYHLSMVGGFQIHNAVLALVAARRLHISEVAIRRGLRHAKNPVRCEIVSTRPLIIVDGAHNPEKMQSFMSSLQVITQLQTYTSRVALISLKFNKDAKATLWPLVKQVDTIVITGFDHSMLLRAIQKVVRDLKPQMNIIVRADNTIAYKEFRRRVGLNDLGIITGSLYMIGNLRALGMV